LKEHFGPAERLGERIVCACGNVQGKDFTTIFVDFSRPVCGIAAKYSGALTGVPLDCPNSALREPPSQGSFRLH
jgi:hypothetical protein